MNTDYRCKLNEILNDLESTRARLNAEMLVAPAGDIHCYSDRGRIQYLQVVQDVGGCSRRGINRDKGKIRALARKAYLKKQIDILNHNIELLNAAVNGIIAPKRDEILAALSSSIRGMPQDHFLTPLKHCSKSSRSEDLNRRIEGYRKWANEPYPQNSYNPGGKKAITNRGLRVRSKSEGLIANALYDHDIPFRYEQNIYLGSILISPDFSIMTASGDEIFWEHAGMLNDPKYSFRHHLKMMQYEAAGIYPWQDLIVTFDTNNEINMMMIESIIETLVVPRL